MYICIPVYIIIKCMRMASMDRRVNVCVHHLVGIVFIIIFKKLFKFRLIYKVH